MMRRLQSSLEEASIKKRPLCTDSRAFARACVRVGGQAGSEIGESVVLVGR